MKCPYCDQFHPEGTDICPETGKPLEQLASVEPAQEYQPVEPIEASEASQAGQAEMAPTPPASPAAENLPEAQLSSPPRDTEPKEPVIGEPASIPPAEVSAVAPAVMMAGKRPHTVRWVIGGCIGIPLIILVLLALIAIIDPFNLHAWGRINGSYDAAAEVMPADTGVYFGINLGNAILTHADRMVTPFLPTQSSPGLSYQYAPVDPRRADQATPYDDLFQSIEKETGVKIPEDVSPWIGQYAGIGAVDFTATSTESPIPQGFVLAIEARNLSRADAFLAKLQKNLTTLQGMSFERQTYQGATIYIAQGYGEQIGIAFGRTGRMVIIASSLDTLKGAIDQKDSQALPTEKDYQDLIKVRPRDWTASLYFNYAWIGSYLESVMANSLTTASPLINPANLNWTGMLVSLTAIKQGARLDTFLDFGETTNPNNGTALAQAPSASFEQVIGILPKDTVIYLVSDRFNVVLDGLLSAASEGSGLGDLSTGLEQMLGFSLKEDLADQLTGQWALYAAPSNRGLLAEQSELNLAVSLLVQTNGALDLKPITDGLNRTAIYSGLAIDKKERDGFTYYELGSYGESNPMLAFGAGNGYFTLGTDGDIIRVSPNETDLLVKSGNYITAINALPDKMQPVLYIDLENLLANLREGMEPSARESFNESVSAVDPIHTIAGGSRPLADNIIYSSIVVIISGE